MRSRFLALAGLLAAAPLVAADDPSDGVSEARLKADVERLVAFGTRHTLSEQDNPTRGIGAAVDWGAATFRAISADCGNCLEVVLPERMIEGNRIPAPVRLPTRSRSSAARNGRTKSSSSRAISTAASAT